MTHLAAATIETQSGSVDEQFLSNVGLFVATRHWLLNSAAVFKGLIHQPELATAEAGVDPVSEVALVEQPAPYYDSYEFEPPLEMTGSAVLRVERVDLPAIEWDY